MRVAVLGSSGFVGSAVVAALQGHDVVPVPTPRMRTSARATEELVAGAAAHPELGQLVGALSGCDAVVNAAGNPDASSLDTDALFGANALLPRLVLEAAGRAGVTRFVHVSSAVVQNDRPVLDESEDVRAFSPYSASKVAGEDVLRHQLPRHLEVVRYRPPSVHAPQRRVTRMIGRIARSRFATVARPGTQPSPQALLPNVAAAVAYLATCPATPPAVVVHPWEGVTAAGLLEALSGGRAPLLLPRSVARLVVFLIKLIGKVHQPTAANARRVELLWFGQGQAPSWLDGQGFAPAVDKAGWHQLISQETS